VWWVARLVKLGPTVDLGAEHNVASKREEFVFDLNGGCEREDIVTIDKTYDIIVGDVLNHLLHIPDLVIISLPLRRRDEADRKAAHGGALTELFHLVGICTVRDHVEHLFFCLFF